MYGTDSIGSAIDSVMIWLYITVALLGYMLIMTLCGLVILPMQVSKNPSNALLRRSAALAASPGGFMGLILIAYGIYKMIQVYSAMHDAIGEMQSYSDSSTPIPQQSVWDIIPAIPIIIQILIFLFAALMVIPALRRNIVMYSILIVLSFGFYGYYFLRVIELFSDGHETLGDALSNVPGGCWIAFFFGILMYLFIMIMSFVVGNIRMKLKTAPQPNNMQQPYPPQYPPPQQFQQNYPPPYPSQSQPQYPPQGDQQSPFEPPQPPIPPVG
jgi:hypothetical protein